MRASSSRASMRVLAGLIVVGSLQAAVEASRLIHAQVPAVVLQAVQPGAQQQQQQQKGQQQQQQNAVAPSHRKMLQFNSRWLPQFSGFQFGGQKAGGFGFGGAAAGATAPLARTRDTSDQPDAQQPQTQFSLTGLPFLGISALTAGTAVQFGGLFQVGAKVPLDSELADAFYLTNRLRTQHGVSTLTWNKDYAEDVAKIAGACGGKPQVREDVEDNIAWGYTTFGAAVQAWYDESRRYDYGATKVPPGTEHFVRMVWKDATEMGCAYSLTCRVYICRYSPVHINKGKLSEQVPAPQVDVSG